MKKQYVENKNNQVLKVIKNQSLDENSIFIDVGAQHGQEIFHLKKWNINIVSFECHPGHYAELVKKFNTYNKLELINKAVSHYDGKISAFFKRNSDIGKTTWEFEEDGNLTIECDTSSNLKLSRGSMTTCRDKGGLFLGEPLIIECIDIARIINEYCDKFNKNIDVVKIDTEGTEYELINRLIETKTIEKVDKVYFEDHERKINTNRSLWKNYKKETLGKMKQFPGKFKVWH